MNIVTEDALAISENEFNYYIDFNYDSADWRLINTCIHAREVKGVLKIKRPHQDKRVISKEEIEVGEKLLENLINKTDKKKLVATLQEQDNR